MKKNKHMHSSNLSRTKRTLNLAVCRAEIAILSLSSMLEVGRAETLPPSADTYITEHSVLGGEYSTHAADYILGSIGSSGWQAHPLLRFDMGSLAGRIILGQPRLELFLVDSFPGSIDGPPREVSLREVLVPWDDSVSWHNFGVEPGIQEGTDVTPDLASQAIIWPGDGPRYISWDVPASLVQRWMDVPSANHGVLLFNQTLPTVLDLWFSPTEGTNAAPPRLVFQLSPAEPLSTPVLDLQHLANRVVLTWTNAAFGLQSAPTISGTFTNVSGATSPYTNNLIGGQRFFRLAQ